MSVYNPRKWGLRSIMYDLDESLSTINEPRVDRLSSDFKHELYLIDLRARRSVLSPRVHAPIDHSALINLKSLDEIFTRQNYLWIVETM